VLSANAVTPGAHQLLNVLIGFGIAGTGFGVILAVVGRAATPEKRSMALGIATAAGSGGQVVGPPLAEALLGAMRWDQVMLVFAGLILATLLLLPLIKGPARTVAAMPHERMGPIVARAVRDPSFVLFFLGFFSCGYQLGFLTAHFPAFVAEACSPVPAGGSTTPSAITRSSGGSGSGSAPSRRSSTCRSASGRPSRPRRSGAARSRRAVAALSAK
jgi:nitrate/nitrite transporter NarK